MVLLPVLRLGLLKRKRSDFSRWTFHSGLRACTEQDAQVEASHWHRSQVAVSVAWSPTMLTFCSALRALEQA